MARGTVFRLLVALVGGLMAATLVPAAAVAAGDATGPTRLWYRISATVELTRMGKFDFGAYTDTRRTVGSLRLRSRTAVIVYRQCAARSRAAQSPKQMALVAGVAGVPSTCGELRRILRREGGLTPRQIRALRLVDDVRFSANGQGFIDRYEKTTVLPERKGYAGNPNVICPQWTDVKMRLTKTTAIGGKLSTSSAIRDGVAVAPKFSRRSPIEAGIIGAPCYNPTTGDPVTTEGRIHSGFSSLPGAFSGLESPALVKVRIGNRFGRSFTAKATKKLSDPYQNGVDRITVTTRITFTPCPRGGRTAKGC